MLSITYDLKFVFFKVPFDIICFVRTYLTPPINRDINIKQCISVILARDVHIMRCNHLQGSLD